MMKPVKSWMTFIILPTLFFFGTFHPTAHATTPTVLFVDHFLTYFSNVSTPSPDSKDFYDKVFYKNYLTQLLKVAPEWIHDEDVGGYRTEELLSLLSHDSLIQPISPQAYSLYLKEKQEEISSFLTRSLTEGGDHLGQYYAMQYLFKELHLFFMQKIKTELKILLNSKRATGEHLQKGSIASKNEERLSLLKNMIAIYETSFFKQIGQENTLPVFFKILIDSYKQYKEEKLTDSFSLEGKLSEEERKELFIREYEEELDFLIGFNRKLNRILENKGIRTQKIEIQDASHLSLIECTINLKILLIVTGFEIKKLKKEEFKKETVKSLKEAFSFLKSLDYLEQKKFCFARSQIEIENFFGLENLIFPDSSNFSTNQFLLQLSNNRLGPKLNQIKQKKIKEGLKETLTDQITAELGRISIQNINPYQNLEEFQIEFFLSEMKEHLKDRDKSKNGYPLQNLAMETFANLKGVAINLNLSPSFSESYLILLKQIQSKKNRNVIPKLIFILSNYIRILLVHLSTQLESQEKGGQVLFTLDHFQPEEILKLLEGLRLAIENAPSFKEKALSPLKMESMENIVLSKKMLSILQFKEEEIGLSGESLSQAPIRTKKKLQQQEGLQKILKKIKENQKKQLKKEKEKVKKATKVAEKKLSKPETIAPLPTITAQAEAKSRNQLEKQEKKERHTLKVQQKERQKVEEIFQLEALRLSQINYDHVKTDPTDQPSFPVSSIVEEGTSKNTLFEVLKEYGIELSGVAKRVEEAIATQQWSQISRKEILDYLSALGFEVRSGKGSHINASYPEDFYIQKVLLLDHEGMTDSLFLLVSDYRKDSKLTLSDWDKDHAPIPFYLRKQILTVRKRLIEILQGCNPSG